MDGQIFMAANLQTVEPPRRPISVDGDRTGAIEQAFEHHLCLQSGQRGANAMVDAPAERNVATGQATTEVDVIWLWECRGVPVGGSPEEEHRRPSRDVAATEFDIFRRRAEEEAKWGLQPKCLLNEDRDEV